MSTRDEVLKYLETEGNSYSSGQKIADTLNLSRTAVWKAISDLRKAGAVIEASTNKGYRLVRQTPNLSLESLKKELPEMDVYYFDEIDSTNSYCKQLAAQGAKENTLVVSRKQTQGRGRRGRTFESPVGGIYFSFLLKPRNSSDENLLVTSAISVALTRAIKKVCDKETQIKWVNDIYLSTKKVCGILTEGIIDMEAGAIATMVVGMGINFSTPMKDFADDLQDIVISLYDGEDKVPSSVSQTKLVCAVIREFNLIWNHIEDLSFLDEYRKRSNVIGKMVDLYRNNEKQSGYVEDINDKAHLIVRMDKTGEKIEIGTGEVTLRVKK